MRFPWRALLLALLMVAPLRARGETLLTVDVGWDDNFRIGRWNPIFVTAQDRSPRQVVLEVYAPHDGRYAMITRQSFAIDSNPRTYPVYVPLTYRLNETVVTLRTPGGRFLADQHVTDMPVGFNTKVRAKAIHPDHLFIGLSGDVASQHRVEAQFSHPRITVGYLDQMRLPPAAVGYDALNLLVLNQPNFVRMARDQQEAIADWVRAGGNVLIWPGPEPIPAAGPLVDLLPAKIGFNKTFEFDSKTLQRAGLNPSFKHLKGRELTALPGLGASTSEILGSKEAIAYRRRVGFGNILLLPVDVSSLHFDELTKSQSFWRTTLAGVVDVPKLEEKDPNAQYFQYDPNQYPRQNLALRQLMDWMGNVAGAGSFGFSYIALVLIAMMLIVGPVDWFVLKRLGRQPWTWATTSGWIVLITIAAITIGYAFKSGELHFRTARVIDEADGVRVAQTTLAAIYSPRTKYYNVVCDPASWWEPASDNNSYGGGGFMTEIDMHQDYRGNTLNTPDFFDNPLKINVWNLRYLQGRSLETAPGTIDAKLEVKKEGTGKAAVERVTGTISNRGSFALKDVIVRVGSGAAKVTKAPLAAGETITVSELVQDDKLYFPAQPKKPHQFGEVVQDNHSPDEKPTIGRFSDLATDRSVVIERILSERPDMACVYGEFEAPPEMVRLEGEPEARTVHAGIVRALVSIKR